MENHIPQNSAKGDPFFNTTEYHNCLQQAADYVLKRLGIDKIDLSIVEGSGLLDLSDHLFRDSSNVQIISLHDVPHCPIPTAIGHKQEILYAEMQGRRTIIWNGRIHYYEGYRVMQQAFPAFLAAYMGCSVFLTTNAAGFINQKMAIGDLALITDHISMINKSYDGVVSLDNQLFNNLGLISTSDLYDKEMVDLTREAIIEAGVKLHEGPYCYFALPNYESPAEIQVMHALGAATVGASTLPEQIACYLSGMRRVIISSATSPSAGMSSEQIDGEEVLIGGQKCVANFAAVIPRLVAKLGDTFFVRERPNIVAKLAQQFCQEPAKNLKMTRIPQDFKSEQLAARIVSAIIKKVGKDAKITNAVWLMSDQLASQYLQSIGNKKAVYFINLRDVAPLRTRSYEDAQIIIVANEAGEISLAIRQPYLEGMLPYEYAVILKALKQLQVNNINVYFEASSVSEPSLNGHVHRVSHYYNKRFYKYSETGREYHAEIGKQIQSEEVKDGKYLFVSEGNLLPSKTELGLAKKGQFDLYTITNMCFMDLAEYITLRPNLFAVTKNDLGNPDEVVSEFSNPLNFTSQSKFEILADEQVIKRRPVTLHLDASFDVTHSKECIYETSSKVKEVIGLVDNLVVFERETFETFMNDLASQFKVDKAVRLNLKEYQSEDVHVDLVKITTTTGLSILVLSETLTYQSHVPFQTLLLPMRIAILGSECKNFLSCPHVWSLHYARNPEELEAGDLFVVKDHANISAQSPGIGPNIDEYGPRFYDISSMYEKRFTHVINEVVAGLGVKNTHGEVFWVNNSTIPGPVFEKMAEGLSNEKVCFKGLVKTGISELMAVHHRASQSPYKLTSAMIGIVTDSVIRRQEQHEKYNTGVKNLAAVVFETFSKLTAPVSTA